MEEYSSILKLMTGELVHVTESPDVVDEQVRACNEDNYLFTTLTKPKTLLNFSAVGDKRIFININHIVRIEATIKSE